MLTYDMIRKLAMDEKAAPKLIKLPENFFEAARSYIENKGKIAESKEDRWELESAKRWLQDLLDLRERKVLMLAASYVKSGAMPGDITSEEKEFFDRTVRQVKEFQSAMREMLEGKKEKLAVVALLDDIPRFVGINMRVYGPLRKGEVASIPEDNAKVLIGKGAAKSIVA